MFSGDDLDWLINAALVVGLIYVAFKVGRDWERGRPNREEQKAFELGCLLDDATTEARSQLRQHGFRIVAPDETTQRLVQELELALEALTGTNIRGAGLGAIERLQAASLAVSKDRKRYMPKLTDEEVENFRRHGIEAPAMRHPEAAGKLLGAAIDPAPNLLD